VPDRPRDADDVAASSPFAVALHRRTAVGATAATLGAMLVSACTGGSPEAVPRGRTTTVTPAADPDVALAATVLVDEQRVLDVVLATLSRHPGLEQTLAPARAAHQAHVRLLTAAAPDQQAGTSSASPSPAATPTRGPKVPTRPGPALRALAGHEHTLGALDQRSALAARSGAFARVLGSMSASAAQQGTVLTLAARTAGSRA
jgi:hypothetical protein